MTKQMSGWSSFILMFRKSRLIMSSLIFLSALSGAARLASAENQPQVLLDRMLENLENRAQGTITGEAHCWHLAHNMVRFTEQYRKTKNIAWLDAGVEYYDALIAVMHTSPDGYKGWVGPYIYDNQYYSEAHVTDAILLHHMLLFSEIVLNGDDAELKARYAEKARSYVALAEKHLFEKFDARKTWIEDGPYGAYVDDPNRLLPDDLSSFVRVSDGRSGMAHPFNKQMKMGVAALSLYRLTGRQYYRDRAEKIFAFFKSRLNLFEDHYVWNYWEPFGPDDRRAGDPEDTDSWRHWIAVHPFRNYQAGEISMIVDAYHTGIVFDKNDIERFCRTNLRMYNGDGRREGPEWLNSNYDMVHAALGRPVVPPRGSTGLAGCLWRPLTAFCTELARIAGGETPLPDWSRRHPERPVIVFDFPFSSSSSLAMAAVMPSVVKNGGVCLVASKSFVPGTIKIELFNADGTELLEKIFAGDTPGGTDGREGILIHEWTPESLAAGAYRVRWTLNNGEFREFPVMIEN